MIALNKRNIIFYITILKESYPKTEILKYILRRLVGLRKKFDKDVFIKTNGVLFNCGRFIENCSIVCSYFEDYMKKELNVKEGIFIDVGAHIGKHSIYVGRKLGQLGKVLSIEANKETADLLRYNIKLNNLNNVSAYEYVCSDKNGEIIFFKDEFHTATNSIYKKNGKEGIKKVSVKLDYLFPNIKNVKLMKIDVEGAEDLVICGAKKIIKNNKPKIIFEVWNENQLNLIKNRLLPYNYKIRHLKEDNYVAEII